MESAATLDIFQPSEQTHSLRYKTFIGDGDSSSYPNVVKADPYPGLCIKKGECIGHVQKRVGANLRKLRKELPKERKKMLFGKGKLTDASMNYIQNCYGLAIRQNTDNLYQMIKNVAAILSHCSEHPDLAERHKYCCRDEDSWCSYWNKSKLQKSQKFNLPQNIQKESEIKLLFEHLRHPDLLSKCLHGKTQNVNEAFNNVVWTKCPKTVYVNRKTLEIGAASAVLDFNEGKDGIFQVFKNVGLKIGQIQHQGTARLGVKRKRHLDRKSRSPVKRRRKADRKHYTDKNKESEGTTYKAGEFHA